MCSNAIESGLRQGIQRGKQIKRSISDEWIRQQSTGRGIRVFQRSLMLWELQGCTAISVRSSSSGAIKEQLFEKVRKENDLINR